MHTGWYTFTHVDLICFIGSLGVLIVYHVYLSLQLRNDPRYTIQSVNNSARTAWVEYIMATPSKDILAVQTLRNSTMAATFLASTAVLLIIGVLNLSQSGGNGFAHALATQQPEHELYLLKLTPLLLDLFVAFFAFTLAIRMYNHVGYLINSGFQASGPTNPTYVARLLNRGGAYYTLGMRSYYLSVPFVFWLFGPLFMLIASVILVVALYHIDRSPDAVTNGLDGSRDFGVTNNLFRFLHNNTA